MIVPGALRPWLWVGAVGIFAAQLVCIAMLGRELAEERAAHAQTKQNHAWETTRRHDTARKETEAHRAEEQRRFRAAVEIADEAVRDLARAQADADRAVDAGRRLRHQAARLAASCGRPAPSDSAAAGGGETAEGPGLVLADVLGRASDRARELAAAYDAARAAGLACERLYDEVRGR